MEARDFRGLTESYYQIYQLDEEEKWIQKAIKKPGAFTAKAKEHDMSVAEFAKHVKANPDKFDSTTLKQANLAQTLKGLHKEDYELDEQITPERRKQYKRGLVIRQSDQEAVGKGRPRKRATSPQPGAQHYRKGMTQSHRDTMRNAAREENPERPEGSGSLPKGKKLARQKATGVSAESYDLYDIILSHLLDEGYAETPEAAEVMMVNMSEDWIDSILDEEYLYEMRKEDKVAGKEKTPLRIPGKRGTIQKDEKGDWKKQTPMVGNPKVSAGRYRQGAQGGSLYGYKRHPHGGAHDGMEKGSERGKRLPKGLKPGINTRNVDGKKQVVVGPKAPKTPVEKFKAQKQSNEYIKNANYSKTFSNYTTGGTSPTRLDVLRKRREARLSQKESYEILLNYLFNEGFAHTVESAEVIMVNMSEGWRDSILEKFISPYEVKPSNLQGHSPATKAMQKSDDLQRTEPGSNRQKMQTRRSQQLNRMFQAARRA